MVAVVISRAPSGTGLVEGFLPHNHYNTLHRLCQDHDSVYCNSHPATVEYGQGHAGNSQSVSAAAPYSGTSGCFITLAAKYSASACSQMAHVAASWRSVTVG